MNAHIDHKGQEILGTLHLYLGALPGAFSIAPGLTLERKKANKCYFVWLYYLLLILSISDFVF